jgi:hypothetical protein
VEVDVEFGKGSLDIPEDDCVSGLKAKRVVEESNT